MKLLEKISEHFARRKRIANNKRLFFLFLSLTKEYCYRKGNYDALSIGRVRNRVILRQAQLMLSINKEQILSTEKDEKVMAQLREEINIPLGNEALIEREYQRLFSQNVSLMAEKLFRETKVMLWDLVYYGTFYPDYSPGFNLEEFIRHQSFYADNSPFRIVLESIVHDASNLK